MRGFIAAAAAVVLSAGTLVSTSGAQAMSPASLRSALGQVSATALVERVCREVCTQDLCRKRCFIRPDHNEGYVEGRVYRERHRDYDDRWRHRDYDRGPGVRLQFGFD